MQDLLDSDDLFAHIRMNSQLDPRLVLIVEGSSDVRSLERHTDSEHWTVVPGLGKRRVLETMQKLQDKGFNTTLALVDRDFDNLSGEKIPRNVVRTWLYDREADLLLQANLIDHYIESMKHRDESDHLGDHTSGNIRSLIVQGAASIGRVRWSSVRDDLGLALSSLPVGRLMNQSFTFSLDDVITLAIDKTDECQVSLDTVLDSCAQSLDATDEDLCSGHDLIAILAVSSKWWARQSIGKDEIDRSLGFAIRCDILDQLVWFHELAALANKLGRQLWNC